MNVVCIEKEKTTHRPAAFYNTTLLEVIVLAKELVIGLIYSIFLCSVIHVYMQVQLVIHPH